MATPRKPRVRPRDVAAKAGNAKPDTTPTKPKGDTADPYAGEIAATESKSKVKPAAEMQKEFDAVGEDLDRATADSGGMATAGDPVDSNDSLPEPPKKRRSAAKKAKPKPAAAAASPQPAQTQAAPQPAAKKATARKAQPAKAKAKPKPQTSNVAIGLQEDTNASGKRVYGSVDAGGEFTPVAVEIGNNQYAILATGDTVTLQELAQQYPAGSGAKMGQQPQPTSVPIDQDIADTLKRQEDAKTKRKAMMDANYGNIPEPFRYDPIAQGLNNTAILARRNPLLAGLLGAGAAGLGYAMSRGNNNTAADSNALEPWIERGLEMPAANSPVTGQPMPPLSQPSNGATMNPYFYMQQQQQPSPLQDMLMRP